MKDLFLIYVNRVGKDYKGNVLFEFIFSDTLENVDGVIALAYENIDGYDSYPEKRLCFHFGNTLTEVEEKLYEKDLILNYNKANHEKEK